MPKISVYIIAYNEESKIEAAIKSVSWADEVILVDSGSTDRTAEIAEHLEARVVQVPFVGFGSLRNSAIEACSHEWIFSLDADERCTNKVRDEIMSIINNPNPCDIYHVPRRNYFMGRWIKYSGWYPDYRQPQLFKKDKMSYPDKDLVHEGFIANGRIGYMKNCIWQFPFKDFSQIAAKMERYSNLGLDKLQSKNVKGSIGKAFIHASGNFLRIYLLKRGFLDGWAGFVIAFCNFESTFFRYAKLTEKQSEWSTPPDDFTYRS